MERDGNVRTEVASGRGGGFGPPKLELGLGVELSELSGGGCGEKGGSEAVDKEKPGGEGEGEATGGQRAGGESRVEEGEEQTKRGGGADGGGRKTSLKESSEARSRKCGFWEWARGEMRRSHLHAQVQGEECKTETRT